MTISEILKAQNLTEDQIKAVTDAMKENKIFTASEENLDIRYGKLKTDHEGTAKQLEEANNLIAELKKSGKNNEDLQGKISTYEQTIADLKNQLAQEKLENAIKVGLLSEKVADVDYLTFKLKENGELSLDENGNVKGWSDKISALKTQFPNQFESSGAKKVIENKLPDGNGGAEVTKEAFAKMTYAERLKMYNENPEQYANLSKN